MGRGEVGGGEEAAMHMNRSCCLCAIFFYSGSQRGSGRRELS